MLRNQQPFVLIFKTLNFFGFWKSENLSKFHKIIAFLSYILFLIFSLFVILAYKNIKSASDLSHYLIATPGFVFLNALTANFITKQCQIEKLIEDIETEILKEPSSQAYIIKYLKTGKMLTYLKFYMAIGCAIFALAIPIFMGKFMISLWLPENFFKQKNSFFFMWIMQTWAILYSGPFFIMIQEVLLNLLIIIRGYEAFLQNEMKTLKLEFDQGHRKIRKSIQLHLNLKRYVNNIFFIKK